MKLLFILDSFFFRDRTIVIPMCFSHYKENSKHQVLLCYTDQVLTTLGTDTDVDLIVFFDVDTLRSGNKYSFLFNLNIPVFVSSIDFFYFKNCTDCKWIQKCTGLLHFGHASKLLGSYKDHFPNKIIRSLGGRYVNTGRFRDYKLDKKYDILIYGSRKHMNMIENHGADQAYKLKWESHHGKPLPANWNFYPLRERLYHILVKNKNKYKLRVLSDEVFDTTNEKLSEVINSSWLTVATRARADIPMAKYFEIGASYSGILGNIPSDYEDVFKNNVVEVTEWMTDEEILSTIDRALEDKQKLQDMINRLGERMHTDYSLSAGTREMDNVFTPLHI